MTAEILTKKLSGLTEVVVTDNVGKQYETEIVGGYYKTKIDEYGEYTVKFTISGSSVTRLVAVDSCKQYYELPLEETLNNNSWDAIRIASDSNLTSSVWAVGDAKEITLNGTIGSKSYSNLKTWVYILGFNHNAEREGNNMIHFGGFRTTQEYTGSNSIALDDDKFGSTTSSIAFNMNSSDTNSGGWKTSRMRTTIIDADATSPSASTGNTFLHALPSELKSVMKWCVKYTDNSGGGSDVASYVTSTQDWAFLLSEFKVQGARNYANSAEQIYQKQYDYYKNGNSKIKYKQTLPNSALYWWNRSPYASDSRSFCCVYTGGGADSYIASYSDGFAPGFCI